MNVSSSTEVNLSSGVSIEAEICWVSLGKDVGNLLLKLDYVRHMSVLQQSRCCAMCLVLYVKLIFLN